ncbi:MAG TPA: hypothetical protein PKD83_06780 [Ignavibacteria bacterium]|nr:hypothetical protein [Ignavibacteria bacterium]
MNISNSSAAIYKTIEKKLTDVNKKELLFNLSKGLIYTFIIFLLLGFALIVLEAVFHFESPVRKIFYWGFLSTAVTTVFYFISNYFLKKTGIIKPQDLISYSKKVGNNFDEVKDRLSNSLSLYRTHNNSSDKTLISNELISADIESTGKITDSVNLSSVVSFGKLKKPLYVLFASVLLYVISFAVFPDALFGSVKRIANYNFIYIDNGLGISFVITPGDIVIAKGEKVNVTVNINSTKPDFKTDEIEIFTKQITSDNYELLSDPIELKRESDGSFKTTIENINSNLIYYAEYKHIRSDEYKITVTEHPIIKSFTVSVYPPDFTGLPSRTLDENDGNIVCQEGSTVYFDVKSNKVLSYSGILLNEIPVSFEINGEDAKGSFIAKQSGSYKFVLKDEKGNENKNQTLYNLKVINDEAPTISVIEPAESNYTLKGEKELLLRAVISDDYGFSKLVLGYRKLRSLTGNSGAGNFIIENIPIKNLTATSLEVPYIWVIDKLNLRSGESAEYYMEVTDNTGKSVRSEIRTIQFRSLSDILKKDEEKTKDLKTALKSVFEQAEELQKEIQELKKEAQKNEELGLNEEKKKQLESKVDNMQKNLNSTQKKLEESMDQMKQNNTLSEKTLEQYMELQKMFNKINSPELQKMLEKLREALKKNNPDELKEALKNFKFDEEAFKKYMEKAMELLKKIENMQKFGELTQKLNDIAKKQEELKKDTESSDKSDKNKMDELSKKQNDIKDQTKEFKEELKKLIDEINKMKEQMSSEDLEKLQKQMDQKNTENKMQKSGDELQKSEKSSSEQTQEEIMKDLNEMNQKMQDALSKMMDSQDNQEKMMDKLNDIKKKLEELSKKQQELRNKTDDLNQSEKEEFEKNKHEQRGLQSDLSENIEDLMNAFTQLGEQVTPEMGKELGNAFNKMDNAGKDLGEQKKENASSNQGKAKESLDNAAKMLGDMIGKMGQKGKDGKGNNGDKGKDGKKGKNGKSPGDGMGELMSRLGEIIAQQMGLNGKTGKMGQNGEKGNNGKGNSPDNLSPEQKNEMQRLSLEQEQIKKSMEELNEELKKEQEKSGEKVLGDMDQVQKEMQEIVKELEENRFDDKVLEKQNRILSRMLDAQLSQREKDFEPKRESKPGDNIVRTSPPEIVLKGPNQINVLKEDFLKLQKEGFTDDYEALIAKYLLELKKEKN